MVIDLKNRNVTTLSLSVVSTGILKCLKNGIVGMRAYHFFAFSTVYIYIKS